jgi:hypothetical protein
MLKSSVFSKSVSSAEASIMFKDIFHLTHDYSKQEFQRRSENYLKSLNPFNIGRKYQS